MPSEATLDAARRLERLGFLDVHADRPWEPGGARLLVALRAEPQLTHFDPEWVGYWHVVEGRGRLARLDRETHLPFEVPFSWGPIRVVDRLGVFNSFLGFGGRLGAEELDPDATIAIFTSKAPIARWTGHSQAPDPLSARIGAFFARLMVPIDFVPGYEAHLSAAAPLALYAAMLGEWHAELAGSAYVRESDPGSFGFVSRETNRIRVEDPAAWAEGEGILVVLGLSG